MQGWFDIEVHAKTIHGEMYRAAERQRMIDEALAHGRRAGTRHTFPVARVLGSARAWFAGLRPVETPAVEQPLDDAANVALYVASEQNVAPRPRPAATSELYSGMVVIARGKQRRSLEEPSGARER